MTHYLIPNYAMPTTAAPTPVTTGTAIKTMLQVATPSTNGLKIIRWGIRFATAPTATVTCELVDTAAIAATVTAHVASGVQPQEDSTSGLAAPFTLGTGATGYTATAEGTIVATKQADLWAAPIGVSYYDYAWNLGQEVKVAPSRFLRIRMTTATAISAFCWVVVEPT